ncbi:hypothetical protein DEAC_c16910 [Desulfosporosinus acididurans]|uniref:DUF4376 domain-containing protein n=1 Tax=Desulfosporosinus acididurans TaxID=476652 RepID=A0A0J1FSM3_9FIRM|nr:hypothetical protein [Desulfosporosinus acididurans]KLU66292.1 hypothetical protein DEAC_c16910 [Desulfosporosinus acididurans]
MQIGRRIYYEIATGNVIVDTGERQGDVVETTEDQDFQMYAQLQKYQQSSVGVIQCDYGYQLSNFQSYPFHVDVTKNPIDQTAIVWDTSNPLGATLAQVQQAKIDQINDLYNQKLTAGFPSSATGTAYTFGYGATDQMKFMQLAIMVLNTIAVWPVSVPAKDGTLVSHTQDQYNQLVKDIAAFAQPLNDKQHSYINQVNACTTIDQVNAITVQF